LDNATEGTRILTYCNEFQVRKFWVNVLLWFVDAIYLKVHAKGKGKAIPSQAWTSPEGSRRLRLPDFKTIGT
jgi:hypothetical protein